QRGRAEEHVGAAQSAAPDGRDRRHRVPARPPQADQDQRRVLRLNETQVTRLLFGYTITAPAGAVFRCGPPVPGAIPHPPVGAAVRPRIRAASGAPTETLLVYSGQQPARPAMKYKDLRDFIAQLDRKSVV